MTVTDTADTRSRTTTARAMTWAWVLLTAITIGSWWLAPAHFTETVHASTPVTALVLVLALVKSRLIIRYFMEVRTAPRWLKRSTDAWLGVLFAAVFVIYLF
ncbi:prokaryotic cytochrome C oxidase subunit IV family protein [Mycolicibacterium elephantis DSM 44368]|uniref:Prokaryotic cytochrome C oxidase subunit IV family protein n=2 Tax=Mycobacteriaceae TaxID=1762 RepID=A0A439DRM4_9MYCO|nr:prokaryotic cytochrome C oxidase subunit IV family protein [Mycolicibacterium elephantis DSM 44368]